MSLNQNLLSFPVDTANARDGFGQGLVEAAQKNPNIIAVGGDTTHSTNIAAIEKVDPKRLVQCGVAEQNMMGVAAGLALVGKIPFISTFAAFSPGRNWDQLRVSVCYSNLNVKVVGTHAGINPGADGATHQALEDIAITRVLPNLTVIAPCDKEQTRKAILAAATSKGPFYIRIPRTDSPIITTAKTPFEVGKAQIYRKGKDVTIIACGPLLYKALVAAEILSGNKALAHSYHLPPTTYHLDIEVINCHTIKPLDVKTIVASARKTKAVVTVEEHQITGGLGSAVAEVLGQNHPTPIEMVGMQNCFGESGTAEELIKKYNMDIRDIIKAMLKIIKRK